MIKVFCEKLYIQLESEIEQIAVTKPTPLKRLTASLNCIQKSLMELKDYVIQNPLVDQRSEIEFYKKIKPAFYSHKVYEVELYNLVTNQPVGPVQTIAGYLEDELKQVKRFLGLNAFHYHYYKFGAVELDNLYFVRGAKLSTIPLPEIPESDPGFSTSMDYLFAKFMAYELIQSHLIQQLIGLTNPELLHIEKKGGQFRDLKWTGDAINLVEIAYGIYHTGQVNNGNASLTQIVLWLEENLQINIGRAHRRFTEISRRKRLSPTKYLDQMRDAINKKIENDLTIKHNKH